MRISLVYTGHAGAGPVYSLEMAKALACNPDCQLQVIVSDDVENISSWRDAFENSEVDFHAITTYNHSALSVLLSYLNYRRKKQVVRLVRSFNSEILYVPFGLMWTRFIYSCLHKNLKIITTVHDVNFHDSFFKLSLPEKGSFLLNYGAGKYVDGTVILNNKDKSIVECRTGKPVAVIPHASFDYYFDDKRNKDDSLKYRIGFFGRIEPYKGLDLLVDAFERCKIKNLKLLIAGGGSIQPELMERITNNDRITLLNRYILDEEFQVLLDSVDFVVLPYKRASQSGVIPMCFAAGKTVVATNVGALSEQVPEGTGVLVNPNSIALSEAIDALYHKKDSIKEYSINAKKYADTELSWTHSSELLISFCNKILSNTLPL